MTKKRGGKKTSGPVLPGLEKTLQFGGVTLKPVDTGKGGWGDFMKPKAGRQSQQRSLWDEQNPSRSKGKGKRRRPRAGKRRS